MYLSVTSNNSTNNASTAVGTLLEPVLFKDGVRRLPQLLFKDGVRRLPQLNSILEQCRAVTQRILEIDMNSIWPVWNCTNELQKYFPNKFQGGHIQIHDPRFVNNNPAVYVEEQQTPENWQSTLSKALTVRPKVVTRLSDKIFNSWKCFDFADNTSPIGNIPKPIPKDWIWTTEIRSNGRPNFFFYTLYDNRCNPRMMFIDKSVGYPFWGAVCGPKASYSFPPL